MIALTWRLVKYLFGSGLVGTVGGGDNQPGGGCDGIGVSIGRRAGGGGRENKLRAAGDSFFGGPLEEGGGAKGLLSACPISISRPPLPPVPASPPSLLAESMSFILAAGEDLPVILGENSNFKSGPCFALSK